MELDLKNKVALVLAGSDGIGKGVAKGLAKEGAKVMLFARSEKKLKVAQREIQKASGFLPKYIVGDVRNADDLARAVNSTLYEYGPIYTLFNNCGGPKMSLINDLKDEDWQDAFELCLLSYIRAVKLVLPVMQKTGGGRILNMASVSSKAVIDRLGLSNTFRMGVVGFTKTLSREVAKDCIMANVIGPGRIHTDRINQLDHMIAERRDIAVEEVRQQMADSIPAGRYGTVNEFARMCVFLCSPANSYITGQNINIDGGYTTAY